MKIQVCSNYMPDSGCLEFESNSDPDVVHKTEWAIGLVANCSCPGYTYRRSCWHSDEVASKLENSCPFNPLDGYLHSVEDARNHTCPLCGGPTKAIEVDLSSVSANSA